MNEKTKLKDFAIACATILFCGLLIVGSYYWYQTNKLKYEAVQAASQNAITQGLAEQNQEYEQAIAPIQAMCESSTTSITATELYQCQLISANGNPIPGLEEYQNDTSTILNPNLPLVCDTSISQLTPDEINNCLSGPDQFD